MDNYLIMLYVTLDQEKAIKKFCLENGWPYSKPDLCVLTDKVGAPRTPVSNSVNLNPKLTEPKEVLEKDQPAAGDYMKDKHDQDTTSCNKSSAEKVGSIRNLSNEGNQENSRDVNVENEQLVERSSFTEYNSAVEDEEDNPTLEDRNAKDHEMLLENGGYSNDEVVSGATTSEEKSQEKVVFCSYCTSTFKQIRYLKQHMRIKHNIVVEQKLYPCRHCNEIFPNLQKCQRHLRKVHKDSIFPPRKFICEICGETYDRADHLKAHREAVHLSIKKPVTYGANISYVCELCGAGFTRKNTLNEHRGRKHGVKNVPYHSCELCPKKYDRPGKLLYHMKRDHEKSKTYECKVCNKKFYTQTTLDRHINLCTMTEDAMIPCKFCGKRFKTPHNVRLHVQAAHSKPALECACGQIIRWQSSVAKHRRRCPLTNEHTYHLKNTETDAESGDIMDTGTHKNESSCDEMSSVSYEKEKRDLSATNDCIETMESMTELEASVSQVVSSSQKTNISGEAEVKDNEEIGSEELNCNVNEEIFMDLVNNVGDQVLKVSSTMQETNKLQTNSNSDVIYVIMKE